MKRLLIITGSIIAAIIVICAIFIGIGYDKFMAIETVEHDPQLEILLGGGGNSIVLTSEDGSRALVVDTKMGRAAHELRKRVKAAEVIIVNTHDHPDHTGGNGLYPGAHIVAGAYTPEEWHAAAGKNVAFPDETVPTGGEKVLAIGSETVHIRNLGRAHTWQDIVVYLEKRKMLITGDLVFLDMHPVLNAGGGCSTDGWIAALDSLAHDYDPALVMPGHGPLSDKYAVTGMKDYFTSIRDALDDKKELNFLRKKYTYYHSLPLMSGFDLTVKFMRKEGKG
jgi:glyoxylase-like metal-dependent hydrolase (beta-lactamase superfamily II)